MRCMHILKSVFFKAQSAAQIQGIILQRNLTFNSCITHPWFTGVCGEICAVAQPMLGMHPRISSATFTVFH